ncbi:hypothetical protein CAL7102_07447 [Dulcicalothrix desertica PCC 7102]|nr:hypothetical protein CAL7102_07447 [Dulcicalothrix desertica PCC 7102]
MKTLVTDATVLLLSNFNVINSHKYMPCEAILTDTPQSATKGAVSVVETTTYLLPSPTFGEHLVKKKNMKTRLLM